MINSETQCVEEQQQTKSHSTALINKHTGVLVLWC